MNETAMHEATLSARRVLFWWTAQRVYSQHVVLAGENYQVSSQHNTLKLKDYEAVLHFFKFPANIKTERP